MKMITISLLASLCLFAVPLGAVSKKTSQEKKLERIKSKTKQQDKDALLLASIEENKRRMDQEQQELIERIEAKAELNPLFKTTKSTTPTVEAKDPAEWVQDVLELKIKQFTRTAPIVYKDRRDPIKELFERKNNDIEMDLTVSSQNKEKLIAQIKNGIDNFVDSIRSSIDKQPNSAAIKEYMQKTEFDNYQANRAISSNALDREKALFAKLDGASKFLKQNNQENTLTYKNLADVSEKYFNHVLQ